MNISEYKTCIRQVTDIIETASIYKNIVRTDYTESGAKLSDKQF